MGIFPAAACSLLSMNYCCGHRTTGVVIELLCGHWTDCLFWTIHIKHKKRKNHLRAKVQNGRRLTFEEIARHMQCSKPSSKENIVRSCSWRFFFKLRWVRHIWNWVGSQISPRRAKKDWNIPSAPGRTRSVKCPTPGLTKTIKSPPHALSSPPAGITLIGAFSALGFKCYYRWTFHLLHLGPVITLVPSTSSTDKKSGSLIRIWSKTQPNI